MYASPFFVIRPSLSLPPLDLFNGVRPSHAARSRPLRNCAPSPMLATIADGGKTPRQAARSKKGRQAVANWLKTLELTSARLPADDPMRDYDYGWMWRELGVADLRV